MLVLLYIPIIVSLFVLFLLLLGSLAALLHLARQQSEAFLIAEKLTKPAWAAILGCIFLIGLLMLFSFLYFHEPFGIYFILLAAIAVIVYLVDVRPRVDQVQRGNN